MIREMIANRHVNRRGTAAVMMVVVLIVVTVAVVGMTVGGAREFDLSERRIETIQAFYASEAGMNMAVREILLIVDEDGDGSIGTISDDGNDANNPSFGIGRVVVTSASIDGNTMLTSSGTAGQAIRRVTVTLGGS